LDKIADDDSAYQDLHDMLDGEDFGGASPGLSMKEEMNRQVEAASKSMENMSRMLARAQQQAERQEAQETIRRRAAGLPDDDDGNDNSDNENSSGLNPEDEVSGDLEDYFEQIPAPTEIRKGKGQLLGAEMVRQPKNLPWKMQTGKVSYDAAAMDLAKEIGDGPRQWGRANVLGNPVYKRRNPVTDLMIAEPLPDNIEFRLHGKVVTRREYKKHRKAIKSAQRIRQTTTDDDPIADYDSQEEKEEVTGGRGKEGGGGGVGGAGGSSGGSSWVYG